MLPQTISKALATVSAVLILLAIAPSISMADSADVVAHIEGKPVTRAELARDGISNSAEFEGMQLFRIALGTLLKRYAAEHAETVPTDAQVSQYEAHLDEFMKSEREAWAQREKELKLRLDEKGLSQKERAEAEDELKLYESLRKSERQRAESKESSRNVSRQMLSYWMTNRALYRQYGGRVIFQQAGPEPIDAYAMLIEERQTAGTIKIMDKSLLPGFWKYIKDEKMHSFLDNDEETRRLMLSDWWLDE